MSGALDRRLIALERETGARGVVMRAYYDTAVRYPTHGVRVARSLQ